MPRMMQSLVVFALALTTAAGTSGAVRAENEQAILAIVNDEPITAFDVNQRIALMVLSDDAVQKRVENSMKSEFERMKKTQNDRFIKFALAKDPTLKERQASEAEIKALQKMFIEKERATLNGLRGQMLAKERPKMRDKALALIVGDKLKLQEAKRLDVLADDIEVNEQIGDIAKRQGVGEKEFLQGLASQGVKPGSFKQHIRTRISWQRVLARKFRGEASVGQLEIDEALTTQSTTKLADGEAAAAEPAGDEVQLQLQRVTLLMPGKLNQKLMAQRLDEADQLRGKAQGCSNMALIARAAENAKHRNLGNVRLANLPAEVRPLLASAEKGMVTPPVFVAEDSAGDSGVQFYAVCSRNTVAASDAKRNALKSRMENSKLAGLSKGLMSDLCSAAFIEYRNGARATRQCDAE